MALSSWSGVLSATALMAAAILLDFPQPAATAEAGGKPSCKDQSVQPATAPDGDALKQYQLAEAYAHGRCRKQDDTEAFRWYSKAAELGYARAQYQLGEAYWRGRGVAEDDKRALAWFRKAAEQDDAEAESILGDWYAGGEGDIKRDQAQSEIWFRKAIASYSKAAEQGDAEAPFKLGEMYVDGRGVPKDYVQAVTWFRKAAERGYLEAQITLAQMYDDGHGVARDELTGLRLVSQGDGAGKCRCGVQTGRNVRDRARCRA